jgi:murein DD-endopeptidase MepM/ murein hydrolase activator NlpD
MPDVRVDFAFRRRRRLRVLVAGITLVGVAAVVRSTVERVHHRMTEAHRLRARLADRRREIDRQRAELTAMAAAVDGLVPSACDLASRVTEVRRVAASSGFDAASPEPSSTSAPRVGDGTASGMQAIATLAWLKAQIADAGDAFAEQNLLASRRAPETHSVPALWPVQGAVTSPFGWRRSPDGDGWEWHPGVDIAAAYGTAVRAVADGTVAFAGRSRGYGVLVVVDHGAATTRYAHLSASWVHAGQTVRRDEPLGALGGTGRVTAPHLHYEVRLEGEPVDPECFLTGPAARALVQDERRSHACALARAQAEGQRSPVAARGNVRTTIGHAHDAG